MVDVVLRGTAGFVESRHPAEGRDPWPRTSARIPAMQESTVHRSTAAVNTPKAPVVYIVASKPRGTLYIGVTSNLVKRIWQHREGIAAGFTRRHGAKTLVWYEQHGAMATAIEREKALKLWPRQRKIDLIRATNPE